MADHGPFRRSLETAGLQGKKTGLRDSCPLGAGMDSPAYPCRRTAQIPYGGILETEEVYVPSGCNA